MEKTMLYLKPKDGLTVRDPRDGNKPLPEYGKAVESTSYWRRRRNDGDVENTTAAAIKKGASAAKPETAAATKTTEEG